MAAVILESVAVPRPTLGFRGTVSSPGAAMAPVSSVSSGRTMGLLPEFRGLKISRPSVKLAAAAAAGARIVRRGVVCEAPETAVGVADVSKSTWQSLVLKATRPVLVEFWAPWCGPCRMMHPVITQLSVEYDGKLDCFKLNTDESPDIATEYGIRSIPTMMIFKNGEKKDTVIGAVPKSTLISSIEKLL